jgi:hypothetical protein
VVTESDLLHCRFDFFHLQKKAEISFDLSSIHGFVKLRFNTNYNFVPLHHSAVK